MAAPTVGSTWSPNTSYTLKVLSVDTTNQTARAKIYARSKTLTEYARLANYYENSTNGYRYYVAEVIGCFKNCTNFRTIPEISSNLTRVSDCSDMFYGCTSLVNTYNFYDWLGATWDKNSDGTLPKTYNLTRTFYGCNSLVSISRTLPYGIKINSMRYCFYGCEKLQYLPMNRSETEYDMECFFGYHDADKEVKNSHRQVEVQDMTSCFENCKKLAYMPFPLPKNLQNMYACFRDCKSLVAWDGQDDRDNIPYTIIDMSYAFQRCTNLEIVGKLIETPPAGTYWVLQNLTGCFSGCTSLTNGLYLPGFISEAPNLIYIDSMYSECTSLENWSTLSAITYDTVRANYLFKNTNVFSSIDFRNINDDFPNIYEAKGMFQGCESLNTISYFEQFNIVEGSYLFDGCQLLDMQDSTITLPSSLRKIDYMFANISAGFNIEITNSQWNPGASDYVGLFQNTSEDIYLLYNQKDSIKTILQTIANSYNNVHYSGDDLLPPTVAFSVLRVSNSGSTTEDRSGTWAYIPYTVQYPQKNIPYNYTYKLWETTFKKDNQIINYNKWINLGDLYSHTFSMYITGALYDENDDVVYYTEKSSEIITQILPSAFALLDFLPGGQGMAIGHFASKKGLDITYPTMIGEGLSTPLLQSGEIDISKYQLVIGKYNEIVEDAVFVIGAGSNGNPSNVFVIDENGNLELNTAQTNSSNRYSGLTINHNPYVDSGTSYNQSRGALSAIRDYSDTSATYQDVASIAAYSCAHPSMGNAVELTAATTKATSSSTTGKSACLALRTTSTESYIEANAGNMSLDGNGNLTLAGHSSSIGSVYEHTASSVSLTSTAAQDQGTGKTILSCTDSHIVPAGCWIGFIYVNFSKGASTVVGFNMSTSNTSAAWSTQMHASELNYGTRIRQPVIISIANDTDYYIRAWSREGCTVNTVTVRLMRIK